MTENSLPLRAKNFLNINFPGNNIESVSLYQNGGGYEVDIDFGYKFIFYNTGLWKKISIINDETKNIGIPRSCIHKSMVNVIDNEYPHSKITDIERRDKNFIIKFHLRETLSKPFLYFGHLLFPFLFQLCIKFLIHFSISNYTSATQIVKKTKPF